MCVGKNSRESGIVRQQKFASKSEMRSFIFLIMFDLIYTHALVIYLLP